MDTILGGRLANLKMSLPDAYDERHLVRDNMSAAHERPEVNAEPAPRSACAWRAIPKARLPLFVTIHPDTMRRSVVRRIYQAGRLKEWHH